MEDFVNTAIEVGCFAVFLVGLLAAAGIATYFVARVYGRDFC